MSAMLSRLVLATTLLAGGFGPARAGPGADDLQNWFNDPFFRISSGVPDCPLPAGPFVS